MQIRLWHKAASWKSTLQANGSLIIYIAKWRLETLQDWYSELKCSFEKTGPLEICSESSSWKNVSVLTSGKFPEQNNSVVMDLLLHVTGHSFVFQSILRNSHAGFLSTTPVGPNTCQSPTHTYTYSMSIGLSAQVLCMILDQLTQDRVKTKAKTRPRQDQDFESVRTTSRPRRRGLGLDLIKMLSIPRKDQDPENVDQAQNEPQVPQHYMMEYIAWLSTKLKLHC